MKRRMKPIHVNQLKTNFKWKRNEKNINKMKRSIDWQLSYQTKLRPNALLFSINVSFSLRRNLNWAAKRDRAHDNVKENGAKKNQQVLIEHCCRPFVIFHLFSSSSLNSIWMLLQTYTHTHIHCNIDFIHDTLVFQL